MLALTLTAELQNVTALKPLDTEDSPFYYIFQLQCTSCREIHEKWVGVSRYETFPPPNAPSKPTTTPSSLPNLVFKCRNCTRTHTLLLPFPPGPYLHAEDAKVPVNKATKQPEKKQQLLVMDCRGLEVVGFRPEGQWIAKGLESGTEFADVKFEEGKGSWEWFDYDEKAGEEVSITGAVFEIGRA